MHHFYFEKKHNFSFHLEWNCNCKKRARDIRRSKSHVRKLLCNNSIEWASVRLSFLFKSVDQTYDRPATARHQAAIPLNNVGAAEVKNLFGTFKPRLAPPVHGGFFGLLHPWRLRKQQTYREWVSAQLSIVWSPTRNTIHNFRQSIPDNRLHLYRQQNSQMKLKIINTGWPKNGTIFVRLNFIKY